ncbi:2-oxo acid dehydrogenase subunit E2 [Fusibacter paucivorans]|uniref:2-oxo acid dehydrogenase subunit E2 n=1 Tax=Fusibacter paucivorans TaxID=76009 RepID=A0ABS5PTT7_9FIRM|nr:2-oxo acid dehydrogenase subunit E2 [Fusibacter paucivorans]MBS7528579.1 2-oxo acid dehydrogenase subunit E2 [Fusibacter paucivorans]
MEKTVDKFGRIIRNEIPYDGIRKVIGTRMKASLDNAPQGTVMTRVDMSQIIAYRKKLASSGIKVSYTDILAKCVVFAIEETPFVNATRDDKAIYVFETINVGIAVMVDELLVVPVLYNAQTKSIEEIADETKAMVKNARDKRFDLIPMGGATFTLNNLGIFDVEGCTPFVNPPESSILAVGAIKKEAWVTEEETIEIRPVTTLSLTIDHSILDGGMAAKFLSAMKKVLNNLDDYLL